MAKGTKGRDRSLIMGRGLRNWRRASFTPTKRGKEKVLSMLKGEGGGVQTVSTPLKGGGGTHILRS